MNVQESQGSYVKSYGRSHRPDKHWRMILEQVQGTRECLWPICTGSISNISILDIRSVMFPVDHGYVGDGATGS